MKTRITEYLACDDCAHYLSTGDSSAIEFQPEGEATLNEIDATLAAILTDEHKYGAFVQESLGSTGKTSSYHECLFCGAIHLGDKTIKVQG